MTVERRKNGTFLPGDKNPNCKIGEQRAAAVLADPRPVREVAASFGISERTVQALKTGVTWKLQVADRTDIRGPAKGERHGAAKLTAADVRAIRADHRRGADIAADFGIHQSNVSLIKLRKKWRHVED